MFELSNRDVDGNTFWLGFFFAWCLEERRTSHDRCTLSPNSSSSDISKNSSLAVA